MTATERSHIQVGKRTALGCRVCGRCWPADAQTGGKEGTWVVGADKKAGMRRLFVHCRGALEVGFELGAVEAQLVRY